MYTAQIRENEMFRSMNGKGHRDVKEREIYLTDSEKHIETYGEGRQCWWRDCGVTVNIYNPGFIYKQYGNWNIRKAVKRIFGNKDYKKIVLCSLHRIKANEELLHRERVFLDEWIGVHLAKPTA